MQSQPIIFSAGRIAGHVRRRTPGLDFITRLVLDDLADRLLAISRGFERAVVLSPLPHLMPRHILTGGGEAPIVSIGTMPGAADAVDPEALVLPRQDHDLIVSLFDLGRVNDVPGYLARLRAHLRPDGLLLAATPGGDTLAELRQAFLIGDAETSGGAFARVAPMLQLADAGPLLQRAGFALPVADIETHTVRYQSPIALMADLKALGASNPLAEPARLFATKALIAAAASAYTTLASDPDGRVRASLQLIWLSGWAPHESQQQPARRGSATISLKDVLEKKPD